MMTKKIAVFEVKVGEKTDLTRNRVELNNTISGFIDQWNTHAAIGVFFKGETPDYRFTFAQRQTVWSKEGMKEIKTHSKRYTYVLGPNESAKTAGNHKNGGCY